MRGADLRKPRRDRIAREAEEAANRIAEIEIRSAQLKEKWAIFRKDMKRLVREYFDFRNDGNYPCEGRLVMLLDIVRLEFFELQKEIGVGGQRDGDYGVPDDPLFGTQGDRQPLGYDEQQAMRAYTEGTGPKLPFRFRMDEKEQG